MIPVILAACRLPDLRVLVRIPLFFTNPMNGQPYLDVPVHGTMMMIGFLAAGIMLWRLSKRDGLDVKLMYDLLFVCMISGVLGARVFYAIQGGLPPGQWLAVWHGGLVWYGGLFGAMLCGAAFLIIAKAMGRSAPFARIMDAAAPPTMLGLAFGRIGCFLNGCCWGGPADPDAWYAVIYPIGSMPQNAYLVKRYGKHIFDTHGELLIENPILQAIHPAQIYSALMVLAVCVILLIARRWRRVYGEQILLMFVLYAPVRYLLELVRAETPKTYLGYFTPGQIVSMMIFLPALAGLIVLRLYGPKMADHDATMAPEAAPSEKPDRPKMRKKKK